MGLRQIQVCLSVPEAMVIWSCLEAHGIPCSLLGDHHASQNWAYLFALGGITVQVPDHFGDQARAVLLVDDCDQNPRKTESDAFWKHPFWYGLIAITGIVVAGLPLPAWCRAVERRF